jgi:hypothetical protein
MAQSPRQLHFVVGTSLLTATLFTPSLGCTKKTIVNQAPPDDLHVNEGPTPEPDPGPADAGAVDPDPPEPEPEQPDAEPDIEEPSYVNVRKVPDRP